MCRPYRRRDEPGKGFICLAVLHRHRQEIFGSRTRPDGEATRRTPETSHLQPPPDGKQTQDHGTVPQRQQRRTRRAPRHSDRKEAEKRKDETKMPAELRETYKTTGGVPFLDNQYTVYGEVVEGLDVVDAIQQVKTNKQDRPTENVVIKSVEVLE